MREGGGSPPGGQEILSVPANPEDGVRAIPTDFCFGREPIPRGRSLEPLIALVHTLFLRPPAIAGLLCKVQALLGHPWAVLPLATDIEVVHLPRKMVTTRLR